MLYCVEYLVLLCAGVTAVFCVQNNNEKLDAKLTADFLEFHEFKYARIIGAAALRDRETKTNEGRNWLQWMHRRIIEGKVATYSSVVPVHAIENGSQETFNKENGNQYTGGNSSISYSISRPESDINIHRLYTTEDALAFKKVFQDNIDGVDWLLFADVTFLNLLHQVYLPINSKVTIAVVDVATATLWQTYQVARHLDQRTTKIGDWIQHSSHGTYFTQEVNVTSIPVLKEATDAFQHSTNLKIKRLTFGTMNLTQDNLLLQRLDLTGLHVRCTSVDTPPYTALTQKSDGSVEVSGIVGEIFRHLQEVTNFTSTCRREKDEFYGSLVNGQWTGMVRDVLDGEADFGAAAFDITEQRSTAVDYLIGISTVKYLVVMKRPLNGEHIWTAYTKEFQQEVWIVLVLFLIVMIVCLSFSSYCLHLQPPLSISEASMTIIGFLLGQGTAMELTKGCVRTIALTALVFHVVLLTHYTSDLVSGLAAGPPLPKIKSILDVNEDPELRLGFKDNSALDGHMSESPIEGYRKIWQDIEANNFVDLVQTTKEGLQRVLKEKNYLFLIADVYFYFTHSQDCRYFLLPTSYFANQYSFVITKGSPLVPIFNKVLLQTRSSGIIDKLLREWIPKLADCNVLETSAMELPTLTVPFLLLGGAMATSILILGMEHLVFKKRNGIQANTE